MSYRSKFEDDALMDDIFNKLNRLGKYASRQELLDEIRDLNLDLEKEKKLLETYRHRYETKANESQDLTRNLDTVRDYQTSLMKEHKELENRYKELKRQNESQKGDLDFLKKELDSKEIDYFLNRRRALEVFGDDRWKWEAALERDVAPRYKYWHWRPWLYRNYRDLYDKYYPYTSYDPTWYYPYYYSSYYPYYSRYTYPYTTTLRGYPYTSWYRKAALEDRLQAVQRMTDDLKISNHRMLHDLKSVRSAFDR